MTNHIEKMKGGIIVTDDGFSPDDWTHGFLGPEALDEAVQSHSPVIAIEMAPEFDVTRLSQHLHLIDIIRISIPAFTDGRGFSQAALLRALGFDGRLRATGEVLPDQYPKARLCGFDEVEISPERAKRQPQQQWRSKTRSPESTYQTRLRQFA